MSWTRENGNIFKILVETPAGKGTYRRRIFKREDNIKMVVT
jgi:hypothetical protein